MGGQRMCVQKSLHSTIVGIHRVKYFYQTSRVSYQFLPKRIATEAREMGGLVHQYQENKQHFYPDSAQELSTFILKPV